MLFTSYFTRLERFRVLSLELSRSSQKSKQHCFCFVCMHNAGTKGNWKEKGCKPSLQKILVCTNYGQKAFSLQKEKESKAGTNWTCKLVATEGWHLASSRSSSDSTTAEEPNCEYCCEKLCLVLRSEMRWQRRKRLVWRPAFERPLASRKADAAKKRSLVKASKARKSWMSVVEHRPSRTHISRFFQRFPPFPGQIQPFEVAN